jgi:cell wall-associated NlpC family hydrolase
MTAAEIIAAARACLGTPFRHQGRLPGIGLDCAGVALHVAQAVGCGTLDASGLSLIHI